MAGSAATRSNEPTAAGKAMVTASMVVDLGRDAESPEWFSLVAFGTAGAVRAKHGKGDMVAVSGKLTKSVWTGKDGVERSGFSVLVDSIASARTVRPGTIPEHNAAYNYFAGMSPEEIQAAQSSLAGWDRATRAFATAGADPAPAWSDFRDPLDAISARFRPNGARYRVSRFSGEEQQALGVLGLKDDSDLYTVRKCYSELVQRYHPDRNGGDRRFEMQLGEVLDAYQTLRRAKAFA